MKQIPSPEEGFFFNLNATRWTVNGIWECSAAFKPHVRLRLGCPVNYTMPYSGKDGSPEPHAGENSREAMWILRNSCNIILKIHTPVNY